jgi:predicted amidohydrolase YtcJ
LPAAADTSRRLVAEAAGTELVLRARVVHDGEGRRLHDARVVIRDGVVAAIGRHAGGESRARMLEVAAVIPGFVDAHVHVLRAARDMSAVDCRPPAVRSLARLVAAMRARARTLPADAWVEGSGYHELDLAERRNPTAVELEAAGGGRPVRIRHRSGHGVVVSASALRIAGIDATTPDPPDGRVERDPQGAPTGLLLGSAARLVRPPRRSTTELAAEVADLSRRWLELGITTVCDAGPDNDAGVLELFAQLLRERCLQQRIVVMRGASDALRDGATVTPPWSLPHGLGTRLSAGHVKFMLTANGAGAAVTQDRLAEAISVLARAGQPSALHAADLETVTIALDALERTERAQGAPPHRIEHATLLPDALVPRLQACGAAVVGHPLFVRRHGDRYLTDPDENPPAWLHRCGSLLAAGVPVAAASDAPVVTPAPLQSMAAAMTRRTLSGTALGPNEHVGFDAALALHTRWAASLCGRPELGRLRPGSPADLVLLPEDPATLPAEAMAELSVTATMLAGEVVAGSL